MDDYVTVDGVESLQVSPDGFEMILALSDEPDDLLREVISRWEYGTAGLKGMSVVAGRLVVWTELDVNAPAMAVKWLYGGSNPALVQMQDKARELRGAAHEALQKARDVFDHPS